MGWLVLLVTLIAIKVAIEGLVMGSEAVMQLKEIDRYNQQVKQEDPSDI